MTTFQKAKLAAIIAISCSSMNAHAFFGSTDYPKLAEDILSHIETVARWAEEKGLQSMQMDAEAVFQQLKEDQANTIFAQQAFADGRRDQEIQNLEIKREMQSSIMEACDASAMSKSVELSYCATADEQKEMLNEMFTSSIDIASSPRELHEHRTEVSDDLYETCMEDVDLSGAQAWNNLAESARKSGCYHSEFITGKTGGVLSDQEAESAKKAIKIIVDARPDFKQDFTEDSNSNINKKARIANFRKTAMKQLAARSMSEVLRSHEAGDGIGMLNSLHEVNDNRIGDPCWIAKFGGVPKEGCALGDFAFDEATPAAVQRESLLIAGQDANVRNYAYESQLRMQAMMAAMLAAEVHPVQ